MMKYRGLTTEGYIELDKRFSASKKTFGVFIVGIFSNSRKTITRRMWKWLVVLELPITIRPVRKWSEMGIKDYKRLNILLPQEILKDSKQDISKFVESLKEEVSKKLDNK